MKTRCYAKARDAPDFPVFGEYVQIPSEMVRA